MFKKILQMLQQFSTYYFGTTSSPSVLTFSITGMCQSNCKTCNIGCKYRKNPKEIKDKDLKIDEIEKIFKSLGKIEFFNISGGEPFLRNDFPQIIELACKYLKPSIIHSPTNAILSEKIAKNVEESLKIIKKYNPKVKLTIKPSIDGVGKSHDEIRGVTGNFERLKETIKLLKLLEQKYKNFHLELGTVVSVFNIDCLGEIEDWVHKQGIQSYRNEIAETREEFFNIGEKITPSGKVYEKLMRNFSKKIKENLKSKKLFTKLLESMRLTYYQLVPRILKEKRQVIPCYAGITNVHINYDGQVWPCCVIGYKKPMGDLRKFNYSFPKLWNSKEANEVRKHIKDKNCYCPLANQEYSNILMSPKMMLVSLYNFVRSL
jgi:MoaA/NifB/PqqE/SkfB family radical SAM enzyme